MKIIKQLHQTGNHEFTISKFKESDKGLMIYLKPLNQEFQGIPRTFKPNKKADEEQLKALGVFSDDWNLVNKSLQNLIGMNVVAKVTEARDTRFRNAVNIKLLEKEVA
jgi:hypothetical protein